VREAGALLSALADGEASADEVAQLQLHMKTWLSCRARLKSVRAAQDDPPPQPCCETPS
jgi:hypothetical protein